VIELRREIDVGLTWGRFDKVESLESLPLINHPVERLVQPFFGQ